jgi:hypothetical protein
MLDDDHLRAGDARRLYDLGSGTGKLCMQGEAIVGWAPRSGQQGGRPPHGFRFDITSNLAPLSSPSPRAAFLMYPNLAEVIGIELAPSRYAVAEAAARRLVAHSERRFRIHKWVRGREIVVCEDCLPQYADGLVPVPEGALGGGQGKDAAAAADALPSKVAAPPAGSGLSLHPGDGGAGGAEGTQRYSTGYAKERADASAGGAQTPASAAAAAGGAAAARPGLAYDMAGNPVLPGPLLAPAPAPPPVPCGPLPTLQCPRLAECAARGSGARCRTLRFLCGNLFELSAAEVRRADCVVMETDLPESLHARLCRFLCALKPGVRLLTYLNLRAIWPPAAHPLHTTCPLRQASGNLSASDRFATSWAYSTGHHFFLWKVLTDSLRALLATGGPCPPMPPLLLPGPGQYALLVRSSSAAAAPPLLPTPPPTSRVGVAAGRLHHSAHPAASAQAGPGPRPLRGAVAGRGSEDAARARSRMPGASGPADALAAATRPAYSGRLPPSTERAAGELPPSGWGTPQARNPSASTSSTTSTSSTSSRSSTASDGLGLAGLLLPPSGLDAGYRQPPAGHAASPAFVPAAIPAAETGRSVGGPAGALRQGRRSADGRKESTPARGPSVAGARPASLPSAPSFPLDLSATGGDAAGWLSVLPSAVLPRCSFVAVSAAMPGVSRLATGPHARVHEFLAPPPAFMTHPGLREGDAPALPLSECTVLPVGRRRRPQRSAAAAAAARSLAAATSASGLLPSRAAAPRRSAPRSARVRPPGSDGCEPAANAVRGAPFASDPGAEYAGAPAPPAGARSAGAAPASAVYECSDRDVVRDARGVIVGVRIPAPAPAEGAAAGVGRGSASSTGEGAGTGAGKLPARPPPTPRPASGQAGPQAGTVPQLTPRLRSGSHLSGHSAAAGPSDAGVGANTRRAGPPAQAGRLPLPLPGAAGGPRAAAPVGRGGYPGADPAPYVLAARADCATCPRGHPCTHEEDGPGCSCGGDYECAEAHDGGGDWQGCGGTHPHSLGGFFGQPPTLPAGSSGRSLFSLGAASSTSDRSVGLTAASASPGLDPGGTPAASQKSAWKRLRKGLRTTLGLPPKQLTADR